MSLNRSPIANQPTYHLQPAHPGSPITGWSCKA